MKSFVQSMYLLTNAFGSALGEALTPTAADPKVLWMYAGLGIASFVAGCLFWLVFHHLNDREDEMNALEAYGDKAVKVDEAHKMPEGTTNNEKRKLSVV